MTTAPARMIVGICLSILVFSGSSFAAEPMDVGKFVKARIEIGEMMTNYFKGSKGYGDGQRPTPEAMQKMGMDINRKVAALLATHDLTIDEYRQRSPEIFANDTLVQGYLSKHLDLKERYDALPHSSMGHGGSGRGY